MSQSEVACSRRAVTRSTAAERRSLWHDRNFLTLWSGQALSQFGAQISELALPVLAVLVLHATEFEVGVLTAANVAAFLIIGLPAGAWIDRMRKRHVMIWADAVRAVTLWPRFPPCGLSTCSRCGTCTPWPLVVGVATVFFDVSYQSIIPSLVPAAADRRGERQARVDPGARRARRPGDRRLAHRRTHAHRSRSSGQS